MKPLWSSRTMPKVHARSASPAKSGALAYLPAWEYAPTANRLATGRVEALLDATTFAGAQNVGEFETIFERLPESVLRGLSAGGQWIHHRDVLLRYRRARNEAVLSVRQGNRWGCVVNAPELLDGVETERDAMATLNRSADALKPLGLRAQDLRGPGYVAGLLSQGLLGRLPRAPHLQRFLDSFRGGRFEATTFGTIPLCHDYDISSAYPHYLSNLISTSSCTWHDTPDLALATDAIYAAALCDVDVPDALQRGPIAHRYGEESLFFPVGRLHKVWLNLPEIRLLLDHPDTGRITKVHQASWGVPFVDVRPYAEITGALYQIRGAHPEVAAYVKRIMVSLWGKTWSRYPVGRGMWQSPRSWNPVYASAVTSQMRADNYRRTLGRFVFGEFIDGFALAGTHPETPGMGGIRHEGSGKMLVVTDLFKKSSWKQFFVDFESLMRDTPDAFAVEVRAEHARTLAEVVDEGLPPSAIGVPLETVWPLPLGTSIRDMDGGGFTCRDFLSGAVGSAPIREEQMPIKVAMRGFSGHQQGFDGFF